MKAGKRLKTEQGLASARIRPGKPGHYFTPPKFVPPRTLIERQYNAEVAEQKTFLLLPAYISPDYFAAVLPTEIKNQLFVPALSSTSATSSP